MNKDESPKRFDLEERTIRICETCARVVKRLNKTIANAEDSRLRIKICRKEAETRYWLRLIEATDERIATERDQPGQEAQELMNIFGAIVRKSE